MIIKILNNSTPYGKIMASHEGSLHSSTLKRKISHDLVVHVEICLILYVLDSRDGHFGNMQIKKCHHLY